jgi:hypothetical protein
MSKIGFIGAGAGIILAAGAALAAERLSKPDHPVFAYADKTGWVIDRFLLTSAAFRCDLFEWAGK